MSKDIWISVNEKLPKESTPEEIFWVWGYYSLLPGVPFEQGKVRYFHGKWRPENSNSECTVTHWMPIPKDPEEKTKKIEDDEILERFKKLTIDCPDCEFMYDDDQYQCAICGCEGGQGKINVFQYLTEHPSMIYYLFGKG